MVVLVKEAVMECWPRASVEVVKVAVPAALRVAVARELGPSKNVTVPTGTVVVPGAVTVAVKVTGRPSPCGLLLAVTAGAGGEGLTTISCEADWLGAKATLPG